MNMKNVEILVQHKELDFGGMINRDNVIIRHTWSSETIAVNIDHITAITMQGGQYKYKMCDGTVYTSDYDWFETQESAPTVDTREESYLNYDKGLGGTPEILDRVEICYTNSNLDTKTGLITGWSTLDHQIAIVTLDYVMKDDVSTVTIPVVCLKHIH